jgi:hypothetical protein
LIKLSVCVAILLIPLKFPVVGDFNFISLSARRVREIDSEELGFSDILLTQLKKLT